MALSDMHGALERLAYICNCERGTAPHIHWDIYRGEPEKLNHPEPWPPTNPVDGAPVPKDDK